MGRFLEMPQSSRPGDMGTPHARIGAVPRPPRDGTRAGLQGDPSFVQENPASPWMFSLSEGWSDPPGDPVCLWLETAPGVPGGDVGVAPCSQTPPPEAPGAVRVCQTRPGDFPSVIALCVVHGQEMRLQSRSRSACTLARPVGMAGCPFPPDPPGISFPSGCCSSAFSPRSPEGPGAGGLEGTREGPGKGWSSSSDTVRPGVGVWLGRDLAPESGRRVHRGPWSHPEARRLPVVHLGVRSPRWPKYWSFSFSIRPSNEYSGLISFRFDLLAVQGTLKSLLQHHGSKASILQCSAFFIVQLSHPYVTTGKTIALTRRTFLAK